MATEAREPVTRGLWPTQRATRSVPLRKAGEDSYWRLITNKVIEGTFVCAKISATDGGYAALHVSGVRTAKRPIAWVDLNTGQRSFIMPTPMDLDNKRFDVCKSFIDTIRVVQAQQLRRVQGAMTMNCNRGPCLPCSTA